MISKSCYYGDDGSVCKTCLPETDETFEIKHFANGTIDITKTMALLIGAEVRHS